MSESDEIISEPEVREKIMTDLINFLVDEIEKNIKVRGSSGFGASERVVIELIDKATGEVVERIEYQE